MRSFSIDATCRTPSLCAKCAASISLSTWPCSWSGVFFSLSAVLWCTARAGAGEFDRVVQRKVREETCAYLVIHLRAKEAAEFAASCVAFDAHNSLRVDVYHVTVFL